MRATILPLLALFTGCTAQPHPEATSASPATDVFRSYDSGPGARLQSTLLQRSEAGQQTLKGVTQLADGSFVAEEATLDHTGRLVHAEARTGGACGQPPLRIVLDARAGTVDMTTPQLSARWSVPTDLPWVWSPLLGTEQALVATPLSLAVALRAASSAGPTQAVRVLDLMHYQSDTLMVDQLVVSDASETHVVLGDDVAEVEDGLPRHVHLSALDRELESQSLQRSAAWAAVRCAQTRELSTL